MNTFTADQIALQAHIEASNAKFVADCKARGATFWTTTVADPAHWAEYGVYTVAQYERYGLEQDVWELYKDVHGFRPRHMDMKSMSDAELESERDSLIRQSEIEQAREEEDKARAVEEFKALIQRTIELGAGDEETALRWLTQDEKFYHIQDVEHYVWKQGILFTDYGRELVDRLQFIVDFVEVA